jgi:CRISPR system Cascade subunit CasC
MNTKYDGVKVEFHILQSFPVTCLNRDDVGAPKTAVVGGVVRARVSSQAWKRQVRLSMHDFGITLAVRTKHVSEKIAGFCKENGVTEEQSVAAGDVIATILTKDTLHFFTNTEAKALASFASEKNYTLDEKKDAKEVIARHKKSLGKGFENLEGLDIALFGRMVAQAADLNMEASASFAHAISTHKVANELEFFTALDDEKPEDSNETGSSHMGSLEFNSATYYRYVGLDIGQLVKNLGDDANIATALEAFIKALYVAIPTARQTTQSGSNPWDYAKVYVRKGQRLQASFENPVKAKGEGYLKPSIEALETFLLKKEKLSGSLFGKIQELTWGLDEDFSIDDLVAGVVDVVRGYHG